MSFCVVFLLLQSGFSSAQGLQGPPSMRFDDQNGVNIISGIRSESVPDVSIGNGSFALPHTISTFNSEFSFFIDQYFGGIARKTTTTSHQLYTVTFGGSSEIFNKVNGVFEAFTATGSTLVYNTNGTYTYTKNDGTEIIINESVRAAYNQAPIPFASLGSVTKATYPNGLIVNVNYKTIILNSVIYSRIQSVTNNTGVQLKYKYISNTLTDRAAHLEAWARPSSVTAINNAYEFCDPLADSCTLTKTWPKAQYTWPTTVTYGSGSKYFTGDFVVVDSAGVESRFKHERRLKSENSSFYDTRITAVQPAGMTDVAAITMNYDEKLFCNINDDAPSSGCTSTRSNILIQLWVGNTEWRYMYGGSAYTAYASSVGPDGSLTVWLDESLPPFPKPFKIDEPDGTVVHLTDFGTKVSQVDLPVGHKKNFFYDLRGNLETVVVTDKATVNPLPTLTETADYDATCSNQFKCNKPNYIIDARGNRTDYAYYDNGLLKSVTKPAGANTIRPQTRYFYAQRNAWFKNASGAYVSGGLIWLLTRESFCKNGAASGDGCATTDDEVITTYDYGSDTGPNNLWLRGVVNTADGKSLRTCYSYDSYGNKISETAPKAGLTSCP